MATAGVNIYYHCAGLDVYNTAVPVHVVPLCYAASKFITSNPVIRLLRSTQLLVCREAVKIYI